MPTLLIAAGLTFHALPGGAAEFLAPECAVVEVGCTNTPGSAEWYVPVERLRLPVAWRIARNGHAVTNSRGSARIALAPTAGLWPSDRWHGVYVRDWYCGYDVANADYVRLPGESAPDPQHFNLASPEMFSLTWNTHVGSTNYHYSALACSNDDYYVSSLYSGRELFKPQSSRFDSVARSALLASCEAYYERLYYASQGQRNEWETDDWGETDDPRRFDFSPTNGLVSTSARFRPSYPTNDFERADEGALRPVPASRRLTDADNVARFVAHVRDIFPPLVEAEALYAGETGPRPEVLDARPFVFRPHWLTDQSDYPSGDRFGARLWWASTVPHPVSTQRVWSVGQGNYIESTTLGLFPEIDGRTVDELYAAGVPFSCYATTLDMLEKGDNFSPLAHDDGPCYSLFRAVFKDCPSAYDARLTDIGPFEDHGLTVPGFLTNCYPRAAASVPNAGDAYTRYVDVGTDTRVSRRMVPGRLDLVNQLLSVMDRTIMIPSMHVTSTNETHAWRHSCRYAGDKSTFEASWNGGSWDISGIEEHYELSGTPELAGDGGEEVVDGIRASVSATHSTTNYGKVSFTGDGEEIGVDDGWMRGNLACPSTNFVQFGVGNMGVAVIGRDGNTLGVVGVGGVKEGQPLSFPFTPSVKLERNYETSHAASAGSIGTVLGPHQPGFEAGERAHACTSAVLAVKTTDSLGFGPTWRSEVGGYEPGGLADVLASFGEARRAEVIGDLEETCGEEALTDPAAYIPLPSSARLVFGETSPTADGSFSVNPRPPLPDKAVTNTIYHFTLAVPGETVDEHKYWTTATNALRSRYVREVRIDHVFDTNMVETTTAVTNPPVHIGSAPGSYYLHYPVETIVNSIVLPDPPEIELVYTNDYPATVVQTGTTITNTAWANFFDAFEVIETAFDITESYTFESDHTRDWTDTRTELEERQEPTYLPEVTSNSATAVELTVTNSLPEDAVEQSADRRDGWATAETVFVVDAGGAPSVWHYWANPLTGEESWTRMGPPYVVGSYSYDLDLRLSGAVDADVGPERGPFDESVFFRVMTQVDWLWNFMRLEKDDQ